jgi:signal transduction histidine kinase
LKREHSSASEVAKARMRRIVARNLAGEVVHDQWTLPIRPGETVSVNLVFRGVLLPDRRQAALVLAEPKSVEQDVAAKRGVEALRQTPVRIAIHPLEGGAPLMRNPASIEAFGGDERYGPALTELFDDPTLFEQLIAKVRTEGHATSEAQLRTQSGLAWHSVDLRKMRDAVTAMPVVQFNARDIDDLKTAQAELVQARLAAEAATRARTEFLAHVSHEIRTPLNGLIGLAQVLSRSPLQDNDRRHVDMMVDIGRSLLRVVGDVLDLSKVEAGKLSLQPIPMRVRIATAHSLAPLQVQAAMQMLLLEWHVDDDVPDTLVTDPLRWGQILLNLAGNALKFTEQGSVQVRVKYQDEGHFKGLLSCTVKDTGVGMTPAQLARAFEPYAQVNEHATSRGTGLGLPIVMRLLDLMGGTLDAHSAPGDGSTFTFHVPANRPGPPAFDGADELLL